MNFRLSSNRVFLAIILQLFFVLSFFDNVAALRCYACGPSRECEDKPHTTVECDFGWISRAVCTKRIIGDYVARGCFAENFCRDDGIDNCFACSYDYCNSATNINLNYLALVIFIPLFLYLK
uniref:CSON005202 protein n=1 Tax=Culicoides sonorensis TaxID=179676 RepID=A0A336L5R8_CULSO